MKNLFAALCFVVCFGLSVRAQAPMPTPVPPIDINTLTSIGAMNGFTKINDGLLFNCADNSQVRLYVLAPDLIRIRASFRKPLPERDHSWAIEKTVWNAPRLNLNESADAVTLSTDELEISVRRRPFLIEFRDAKTHEVINADERPMLYDLKSDAVGATKRLGFEEHFFGLGEKAARLDKRRGRFQMWNSDTPSYKEDTDPIYQSIPFYIGWQNGAAYGIFFDNSYRTNFDFGKETQEYAAFTAEGGEMNYYFFQGPSIKKILARYADLTGHMPLPPVWALGHQQSRWSYYPDKVAEEVVRRYREEDLPLDVLHLDIDFMSAYRVFTWDRERFPDPQGFVEKLKRQGVKTVVIVDPGVKYQPPTAASEATSNPELQKQEQSYYVFNQGLQKNFFMMGRDNKPYVGKVWPGDSVYVDYTLPEARKWWGDLHRAYTDHGVAGIWNDMNEPSDFVDQTGNAMIKAGVAFYDEGQHSSFLKNRNVFALLEARATYEGLQRLQPDKRPYVITRAGYAGIQRYSTMWTGDTDSTWDALALSIPMFATLGLSGQPFVGGDIGGFIKRGNGELLTRWYQMAFLAPFCRNHKNRSEFDQEPWRFGKTYEDIIRKYLKLRYRMMPFLYSTLEEAHRTGVPVFRPLLLNYQNDYNTLNLDDEFMIGTELLLAPILKPDVTSRLVYLPEGVWYDYWTGKQFGGQQMIRADAPLETVPMYVRAGSIIALMPEMNYIGEKPLDPITFEIYPNANKKAAPAAFTLYEDDGSSPQYQQGTFLRTTLSVSASNQTLQINLAAPAGNFNPGKRNFVFVIKAANDAREISIDGKRLPEITANDARSGWYKVPNGVAVRLADEGRARQIQIKTSF
jgi:alpha-glucosidase